MRVGFTVYIPSVPVFDCISEGIALVMYTTSAFGPGPKPAEPNDPVCAAARSEILRAFLRTNVSRIGNQRGSLRSHVNDRIVSRS